MIIKKVYWKIMQPIMQLLVKLHKVKCGNIKAYGYPRIHNEGRIILRDNVELQSTNSFYLTAGFVPNCLLVTYNNGKIIVMDNVHLNGTTIISSSSVFIDEDTMIGNNCLIMDTDVHPINPNYRTQVATDNVDSKSINIGKNVWIGSNVTILKGVSIEDNSIIGTGSVLTCNVPENCIYAGNPARFIKKIEISAIKYKNIR